MRMLAAILIPLLIGLAGMTHASVEPQNNEALRKKIDEVNRILDEASLKYDFETMADYYAEDVIILPNNEPIIRGWDAFVENEKKWQRMGVKVLSIKGEITDLFHDERYVHEIGTYEIKLQIPGLPEPYIDAGKYLVIWEIQKDGSLRIKLETWNNDKEPSR